MLAQAREKGYHVDRTRLVEEIEQAMRAKDKVRLSILRLVKNEIDMKEKESGQELASEDVIAALKKILKQTGETLEASEKAGTNAESTETLREQVDILSCYLPEQVTGDALMAIIERVMAENDITEKRDMGRAIGLVIAETGGNCDKAEVARIIGSRLSRAGCTPSCLIGLTDPSRSVDRGAAPSTRRGRRRLPRSCRLRPCWGPRRAGRACTPR